MGDVTDREHGCSETLAEIERFLDGEADQALRDRVGAHLADCTPCMDRADFRTHLKDLVRDRCREQEVPDALVARIEQIIRERG